MVKEQAGIQVGAQVDQQAGIPLPDLYEFTAVAGGLVLLGTALSFARPLATLHHERARAYLAVASSFARNST